ncbi:MAG: 50S ribosomal protein L15 [Candidatus Omnitrophica bacterium]|nr:50S ribosomal protein L15 [Candidatus Omnitrophota bacterium]
MKKRADKEKEILKTGLFNLTCPKGAHKKRKYLGRGSSSGHGKTSTRGSKGQTSRAGRHFYLGFEGGQSPLIRKMPKRGFVSIFKKTFQIVSLDSIAKIKEGVIDPELLKKKGLIKDKEKQVKILGNKELKAALTVKAHAFSKQAAESIKKAGGTIETITINAIS